MGNTAKNDAKRLTKADKARRAAEMRIEGKTLQAIADELGYAHRSTVRKVLDDYRRELPREAVEELRDTLLERAEANYAVAKAALGELKTPKAKLRGAATVATILEKHARVGHVIQEAPPVAVNVTQNTTGINPADIPAEDLPKWLELMARAKKQEPKT